jgi:uncharacterized repeat protein (TIGR02543 family)
LAEQVNGTGGYNADPLTGKYIRLTADIDLSGYGKGINWQPIGNISGAGGFRGNFDGGGFTVSNLYIDITGATDTVYAGLFGFIYNANILNLGVSGEMTVTAASGAIYAGGIIGSTGGTCNIINSYSAADITTGGNGYIYAGGIAGYVTKGNIAGSYNIGMVSGTGASAVYVGGFAGYVEYCNITSGYNTGAVSAKTSGTLSYAGGIVGHAYYNCNITSSYNEGKIRMEATGNSGDIHIYVGGIAGSINRYSNITNGYNAGEIITIGTASNTTIASGGIAGETAYNIAITDSYNRGIVAVFGGIYSYVGGIIGSDNQTAITACYNIGSVTAKESSDSAYAGGIAGNAFTMASITSSYNTGAVSADASGNAYVGGIFANSDYGILTNSHNTGNVTASGNRAWTGGLIGFVLTVDMRTNYNTGAVTVNGKDNEVYTGGLIGGIGGASNITSSFNAGVVNARGLGDIYVGGIGGKINGGKINIVNITSTYNTGALSAGRNGAGGASNNIYIGGIAGYASTTSIINSYSAATAGATGTSVYTGGIAGYATSCNISSSYYDKDKLGLNGGAVGNDDGLLLGAGLKTEQMTAPDALTAAAAGLGGEFIKRAAGNGIEYYPELRCFSASKDPAAAEASMLSAARAIASGAAIYKITYDYKGGVAEAASVLVASSGGFRLVAPVKEGYVFAGWFGAEGEQYTGADGSGLSDWNAAEDKTLYARWTEAAVEEVGLGGKSDETVGLDLTIPLLCLLIALLTAFGVYMLLKDRKRKGAAAADTAGVGRGSGAYGDKRYAQASNGSKTGGGIRARKAAKASKQRAVKAAAKEVSGEPAPTSVQPGAQGAYSYGNGGVYGYGKYSRRAGSSYTGCAEEGSAAPHSLEELYAAWRPSGAYDPKPSYKPYDQGR